MIRLYQSILVFPIRSIAFYNHNLIVWRKNRRQIGCYGNTDGRHKIKCHVHFDRASDKLNEESNIIQIGFFFFGHIQFLMHISMFGERVISEVYVQKSIP